MDGKVELPELVASMIALWQWTVSELSAQSTISQTKSPPVVIIVQSFKSSFFRSFWCFPLLVALFQILDTFTLPSLNFNRSETYLT